ncbi:MAG: DUF433 domain-containing protein [Gemmatales bacterium]
MNNEHNEYVVAQSQGGWLVAGTRISLASIIHAYWNGRLPESIIADFPTLSLEKVHGAIAYYLKHRSTVDQYLETQDEQWEQFKQKSTAQHNLLIKRMRETVGATARL